MTVLEPYWTAPFDDPASGLAVEAPIASENAHPAA